MTDARSARCCSRFSHESLSCGVPFVIEEPLPRQGCDSVWLQQKQPRAGGSTWTFQAVSTFLLCPSLRGGGAPAPRPLSREPAVFATWAGLVPTFCAGGFWASGPRPALEKSTPKRGEASPAFPPYWTPSCELVERGILPADSRAGDNHPHSGELEPAFLPTINCSYWTPSLASSSEEFCPRTEAGDNVP